MQEVSHEQVAVSRGHSAFDRLKKFLLQRRTSTERVANLESFERQLPSYMVEVEGEVLAEELAHFDVDLPAICLDGVVYRKVLRCAETYVSAAGPLRVMRSL
jgi:hypothetical protein